MIASSAWSQLPDHWALLPLDNFYRTTNILKAFVSAIHAVLKLVELYLSWIRGDIEEN